MRDAREHAVHVVRTLREAGHEAVFAGGCVRDMLLGGEPDDYDVATDAVPARVRELFGRKRTLAVGEAFGVIVVLGDRPSPDEPPVQVEVATFRADGEYADGRRPKDVRFSSAEEDAQRRDFTINGLFYDPLGDRVLDYVGGRADLEAGVVRAIGDADARLSEDKLRSLRAVRFATRFGFRLDAATAKAVRRNADGLRQVSRERVAQELAKMLRHPRRADAVAMMADLGLLPYAVPQAPEPAAAARSHLEALKEPSLAAALVALLRGVDAAGVRAACRGLKLSNRVCEEAAWLASNRGRLADWESTELADRKTLLANEHAGSLLELERAGGVDVSAATAYREAAGEGVLDPPPLVTGDDLIARGLKPSKRFKEILEAVRRRQLNEELAGRDAALAEVDRLVGYRG